MYACETIHKYVVNTLVCDSSNAHGIVHTVETDENGIFRSDPAERHAISEIDVDQIRLLERKAKTVSLLFREVDGDSPS